MKEAHTFQPGDLIAVKKPSGRGKDCYYVVRVRPLTLSCVTPGGDVLYEIPVPAAEYLAPVTVSAEQARRFARFEIGFRELASGIRPAERLRFPEPVRLSADDLLFALRQVQAKEKTADRDWFDPLLRRFIPRGDVRFGAEPETDPGAGTGYRFLPSEKQQLRCCFYMRAFAPEKQPERTEEAIRRLEQLLHDRELPVYERTYDEEDMLNYVCSFAEGKQLDTASEPELALYVKFLDALDAADNTAALDIKGYALYGGNRAYPCDWTAARDILLRLLAGTGRPYYANTLGYIYYYGRCTDGVPDYEKAFYYYSIGAAGGVYESRYKLADMFRHGYAVPQNPEIAETLLNELYDENLELLLRGYPDNKLADVALRLGRICEEGGDTDQAVRYYLQARCAIGLRREQADYYGDASVEARIEEALEAALPESSWPVPAKRYEPELWELLADEPQAGRPLRLRVKRLKNDFRLTVQPATEPYETEEPMFLVTLPQRQLCRAVRKLVLRFTPDARTELRDGEELHFDGVTPEGLTACGRVICRLSGRIRLQGFR